VKDVTVVIPTALAPDSPPWRVLRRAVGSWLGQRLDPDRFEVVVVRYGAAAHIDAEPPLDSTVRQVRLDGGGLCAAYNAGVDAAQGRYTFLGADDSLAPPHVLRLHLRHHATPVDTVVWSRVIRLEPGSLPDAGERPDDEAVAVERADQVEDLARHCVLGGLTIDIEDRIDERFFQDSRVGWLAMRLGHQSVATRDLRDAGGFAVELDPTGWYAGLELGIRLKQRGLAMAAERKQPLINVPHTRIADVLGEEPAAFAAMFRRHRMPELLLMSRYFGDRLPLRFFEHLVTGLGLPERV
jgi:glycosyltransferase involved in cell wall biosynthesis